MFILTYPVHHRFLCAHHGERHLLLTSSLLRFRHPSARIQRTHHQGQGRLARKRFREVRDHVIPAAVGARVRSFVRDDVTLLNSNSCDAMRRFIVSDASRPISCSGQTELRNALLFLSWQPNNERAKSRLI